MISIGSRAAPSRDEHVPPVGQPWVRLARGEELRRLLLVGGSRRQHVPQAQRRIQEPRPHRLDSRPVGRQLADGAVVAADRRHRVRRIVGEAPRLARFALAPESEPSAPRYQVCGVVRASGHSRSSRQRPPWSSLPSSRHAARPAAHDEDPHGRVGERHAVLAEVALEQPQLLLEVALHAPDRFRPEVDVERPRRIAPHADVTPRPDDQPLRRLVLRRHRREVLGVGVGEAVIPARRECSRDVGMLVEITREVVVLALPELVVLAARVVVEERLLERGRVPQRQLSFLPRA